MSDIEQRMLKKRNSFIEKAHAAFILNTSFNIWGKSIDSYYYHWLRTTYPNSIIEAGNDQGASYITITPKF